MGLETKKKMKVFEEVINWIFFLKKKRKIERIFLPNVPPIVGRFPDFARFPYW